MTTMSQAAARPAMSLSQGGFFRKVGTWAHAFAAHLERRAAIKALRRLDDRELRDIGLVRSHIDQAVWGHVDPDLGRLR